MTLFFEPDDIAIRARRNGLSVFELIKAENQRRKAALDLARQAAEQRELERIARLEREKAEAEERARRQKLEVEERARKARWRRSWARMVNLARRAHYSHRDILDIASPKEIISPAHIADIVREVSELTGISIAEIKSDQRAKHICRARFFIWWRASRETHFSLPEIGRRTGGKDHTSVLYGKRKFQSALDRREPWAVMLAGAGE